MTALPLSGGELVILDARPAGPAKIPAPDLAWHKDKLALAAGRGEGFFDRPRRDLFAMRYHLRRLERLEPDERNWSLQQVALDQIAGNHRSAVARLEPIILRRPNDAPLWYDLGNGRRGKGDLAGAEVAYRRCIESNGQMPEAHCNLGLLLGHQGRFEEAIACLERGDALGQSRKKAGKGWAYPTGQWLARHRRLRDLASRFGDRNDFSGLAEADKTDVVETLLLIGRPLAACTLAQPKPNTSPGAVVIGAALRCADGRGDAKALNPAERARWRGRALAWLRQELADAHRSDPRGRADFVARMQGHPLLQLARPDRLDGWPEAERLPWQALWAEVDALKESP
jgi:tetratricopeptide (TPR) repeat protein